MHGHQVYLVHTYHYFQFQIVQIVKYEKIVFDGTHLFDKVTSVYHSATAHNEDQVPHLHVQDMDICITKCTQEYGNPCENFCPADVYELTGEKDDRRLQINFSNCVHCKTCDIMDPYQIVDWYPPEGGDGPAWVNLQMFQDLSI